MSEENFKKIISHAKEYGFIFQSSEIYDGLSAVYDYGQNGVLLKNNIKEYWWKSMVQLHDNIVGIDSAIFSHPTTWKASGHVDAFNDPLIDNKDSKKRYRADNLIEDHIQKIESKILPKEIQLTDSIRIEVRQPSFHQLSQNQEMMNANTQTEQIFSLIKEVVVAVLTEEERISTKDVTKEEFQEFIDSMTQDQFSKIREYIESIPKMRHNVSFCCTNCSSSNELVLEGLQSFL